MACTFTLQILIFLLSLCIFSNVVNSKSRKGTTKDADADKWKKKDVRDYTEKDLDQLYNQWEEADEDELEEDEEVPKWAREPPKVDMSKVNKDDPESYLKAKYKGQLLMLYAKVSGNPTKDESEAISKIWGSSIHNANVEYSSLVMSENRVVFMLMDGARAWEIKEFLVNQDRCEEVTIEDTSYPGKGAPKDKKDSTDSKSTKDGKKTKKKDKSKEKSTTSDKSDEEKNHTVKTEL